MRKLAIITSHPIQYNAPWFRILAERSNIQVKVFYTWSQSKTSVKDRTFGKEISWDIPLLEGYEYEFIDNVSSNPGSHHFFGIDCPTLIPQINLFQPSAILFFGWKFKSHLKAMRYFKGKIPVWFRGDSTLLDERGDIKSQLRRLILKKVYSYIDKALYVGEANKSYFLKHNLKPTQLLYVPHAIENSRFKDDALQTYESNSSEWRNELGFDHNSLVIVFAGKFEQKKQPDFLIEAVHKVNNSRVNPIQLLLVGSGPMENDLKLLAQKETYIQFLPFQNQTKMPLVYRLGDVFCLPSKGPGETWGLAVNEAMASGRPVIVSNKVGCCQDLVKFGENGYIFDYQNQDKLIEVLESLKLHELKIMGRRAFNDIQDYDFKTIVTTIEHEIEKR